MIDHIFTPGNINNLQSAMMLEYTRAALPDSRLDFIIPQIRVAHGPKFVTAARNQVIGPAKSPHIYFWPARGPDKLDNGNP